MDLSKAIQDLYAEKEKIERSIALLEQIQNNGAVRANVMSRRGRKSMGADERKEVSSRMRAYWASRRIQS